MNDSLSENRVVRGEVSPHCCAVIKPCNESTDVGRQNETPTSWTTSNVSTLEPHFQTCHVVKPFSLCCQKQSSFCSNCKHARAEQRQQTFPQRRARESLPRKAKRGCKCPRRSQMCQTDRKSLRPLCDSRAMRTLFALHVTQNISTYLRVQIHNTASKPAHQIPNNHWMRLRA